MEPQRTHWDPIRLIGLHWTRRESEKGEKGKRRPPEWSLVQRSGDEWSGVEWRAGSAFGTPGEERTGFWRPLRDRAADDS